MRDIKYSIPFTKQNLEELHKKCNDKAARITERTKYSVWPEGGTKISVESYHDFANLDFQTLHKYGGPRPDDDGNKNKPVVTGK
jgi:hypothetical protein